MLAHVWPDATVLDDGREGVGEWGLMPREGLRTDW
jgi:hypothetical protein